MKFRSTQRTEGSTKHRWAERNSEKGSTTVMVSGIAFIGVTLFIALVWWLNAAVAAQRAATAADLAALAAADAARELTLGEPCTIAADIAQRNQAQLMECTITGDLGQIVAVRTAVSLPGAMGFLGEATGRARAGPPPI